MDKKTYLDVRVMGFSANMAAIKSNRQGEKPGSRCTKMN